MKIALSAITAALVLAIAPAAFAHNPAVPPGVAPPHASFVPPPSPKGVMHTLVGTVINDVNAAYVPLPAGTLTNTDALFKVNCPSAGGCTINFRVWGQFNPDADGLVAFCPTVDGNYVTIACSYLGVAKAAEVYGTYTAFGTYAVPQGVHQVRTQAVLDGGGTLISYHYEYEVLAP